jgi:hypothetical protein
VLAEDPTNTAVVLDGGGYVYGGLSGMIGSQGTMTGWFKLAELPSAAGRIFYVAGESTFGDDFDIQIETDNRLKFYTDNTGATIGPTAFALADVNTWHFFAATYNANTERSLYLDGQMIASSVPGLHLVHDTSPFNMGVSAVFGGRNFMGRCHRSA